METNMNKIITTVLIIFTIISANAKPTDIFKNIRNGEYVYYIDNRLNIPFYRGYIYYKADKELFLFIRSVNLKNKEEAFYEMVLSLNNKIEDSKITLMSGIETNNHKQAYIDVLNFITAYNQNINLISYEYEYKDQWEKYAYYYNFNKIAPIFKIYSLFMEFEGKKKESAPRYIINRSGMIDIKQLKNFKNIMPIDESKIVKRNSKIKLSRTNEKSININGIKIILDDNWVLQNNLEFPGYWIKKESIRDAQISFEIGEWKKFKNLGYNDLDDFIKYITITNTGILWDTLKVIKEKEKIIVQYQLIDENKFLNFIYQEHIIKNGKLITINFSSFYDLFVNNHEYFNKIINSIEF